MKYLYESHLGDIFITDDKLDHHSLYCKQCKDECNIDGCGGWSLRYVYPIMIDTFDLPDDAEYENDYDRDCGFCCNSEEEILARILELIKENKQ